MARLIDIAKIAGVSVMTVSKALRDAPDISAQTKQKIKKIADELGYVPNFMARSLRNKKTSLLGLVISSVTNPFFSRVMMAVEEKAFETGYDLILSQTYNSIEREEKILTRLIARKVDGILISPVYRLEPKSALYDELLSKNIPTVLLGHPSDFCQKFTIVASNDLELSYNATKHLLSLGHRRIAFFASHGFYPWSTQRLNGYLKALNEAGIEVDERLIMAAGSRIEDGYKAAEQILSEGIGFTAIQAVNDLVAIGAMNFLVKKGVKIPETVSIIGFGNILISENCRIPLTTINQPKYRLGAAGFNLLLEKMQGKSVESLVLDGELIIRESTAAAPAIG